MNIPKLSLHIREQGYLRWQEREVDMKIFVFYDLIKGNLIGTSKPLHKQNILHYQSEVVIW